MLKRLTEYLDSNSIRYIVVAHSLAYTAQEIAYTAHLPGKEIAKTVIVRIDGNLAMVVLPASSMVDFAELRHGLGATNIGLASEKEFEETFPGCELGAMPPFGNLFSMDTIVDKALTANDEIAFNAGTHRELIRMAFSDFERLVKPKVLSFGVMRHYHATEDEY